jgi:uncharacterized protein
MTNESQIRAAVIAALAEKYPSGRFGRTAVMKLFYFLQTLRRVPLGYHFTLYSYGPFDSNVLSDLDYAEELGAISSEVVPYASGAYGYRISPTNRAAALKDKAADFLRQYADDLDWVIGEFGSMSSAELELASTIVYADREVLRRGSRQTMAELVRRVSDVKPHFTQAQIERMAGQFAEKRLLFSLV